MDPTPEAPVSPQPGSARKGMMTVVRTRLTGLVQEYGGLAIGVYFGIFGLVWVSMALAIKLGMSVEGAAATASTWVGAYLLTKLTQPLRIAATLVITPALGAVLKRFRRRPIVAVAPDALVSENAPEADSSAPGGQSQQ